MSTAELILDMLRTLPEDRQQEVLDFAQFLGGKSASGQDVSEGFDLKPMKLHGWPKDCTFRREDLYGDDGR